jgi:hypothetical protein
MRLTFRGGSHTFLLSVARKVNCPKGFHRLVATRLNTSACAKAPIDAIVAQPANVGSTDGI